MLNGSYYTMPILLANLGGEMVYILEHRLRAQNVVGAKSAKVLSDVINNILNSRLMEEMFKPQRVYNAESIRQLFEELAHSSIMKLSEASMQKLYDLMLMGFKYQLQTCKHPKALLDITENHIQTIEKMGELSQISANINAFNQKMKEVHRNLSVAQLAQIRFTLLTFVQDKKVKISSFLQQQVQLPTGRLVIPIITGLLENSEKPCLVKYFEAGKQISEQTGPFSHPLSLTKLSRTNLGFNMYSPTPPPNELPKETTTSLELNNSSVPIKNNLSENNNQQKPSLPQKQPETLVLTSVSPTSASLGSAYKLPNTTSPTKEEKNIPLENNETTTPNPQTVEENNQKTKVEVDLLFKLMGGVKKPSSLDGFKINDLFEGWEISGSKVTSTSTINSKKQEDVTLTVSANLNKKALDDIFQNLSVQGSDKESDLLDLMDKAN